MYGDTPAKNTVYTPCIPINVWFWPTQYISSSTTSTCRTTHKPKTQAVLSRGAQNANLAVVQSTLMLIITSLQAAAPVLHAAAGEWDSMAVSKQVVIINCYHQVVSIRLLSCVLSTGWYHQCLSLFFSRQWPEDVFFIKWRLLPHRITTVPL
jgi:hypothetical protein